MKNKQLDRLFIFLDFKCYGRRNQFAMATQTEYLWYKDGSGGVWHGYAYAIMTGQKVQCEATRRKKAFESWLKDVIRSKRHLCVCDTNGWSVIVTTMGRAVTGQWDETTSMCLMMHEWDSKGDELPENGTPVEITPEGKWRIWK
jgi:hypothetical protein